MKKIKEKQTAENVILDEHDYNYYLAHKSDVFIENLVKRLNNNLPRLLIASGAGLMSVISLFGILPGFISLIQWEMLPIFEDTLKILAGCGGVTCLSVVPSLIGATIETNKIMKIAKIETESKEVQDENADFLYRHNSSEISKLRKQQQDLKQQNAKLKTANEELIKVGENHKQKLEQQNNILIAKNRSLTEENLDLQNQQQELAAQLKVLNDLNCAKKQLNACKDILNYKKELRSELSNLNEIMSNRYSITGLNICEYLIGNNKNVGVFKIEIGYLFGIGDAYIHINDSEILGFKKRSPLASSKDCLIKVSVPVADVLRSMGWDDILNLGTISNKELSEVIKYILSHEETYGFTFTGEIEAKPSPNIEFDFDMVRKRINEKLN